MWDVEVVRTIGIMIVAAAAMVLVGRRIAVPNLVLYILTGLLLGPVGLDLLAVGTGHGEGAPDGDNAAQAVGLVAEAGIALLLFLVGLELSLDKIRVVGKVAVAAGLGQVVFTAVIGFGAALLLQFSVMESIFLATALTFSSTVVVVKLLDQKRHLHLLYGRIAVGIFLVQDLVVIVVLTFLAGLGQPEQYELGAMLWGLGKAFLGMGALLGLTLLASTYLLVRPMAWAAASAETVLVWSLCWCFALVVGAEALGLSPEIGAFLAGLSLAQLPAAGDLKRRVHPLMNFFIAIFFISLGAGMELGAATEQWWPALLLSLFVLLGNPFIFMWIIARGGYSERTSFMTSVTVAQISEFSFIFAAMGVGAGLIGPQILSLVTVVGLITIAVSSYMILYNEPLYRGVRRLGLLRMFGASQQQDESPPAGLSGHVIVVGMNALGRRIALQLHERGHTVLAIDGDQNKLQDLPCRTMVGSVDYASVLEEAALEQARLVISALRIEETNNLLAYRCREAGVPVAIHAFDRSVIPDLRRLGVDYLIDPKARWLDRVWNELQRLGVRQE